MDARLHGFRLGSTETCTLRDLCRYLNEINGVEFTYGEHERLLFAGERDNKCVGVLITLKTQRRFPEIERGESLKVFIHEAEEGRSPFDFNFFAFDPDTGGGVYQHYRGSCAIHRFGFLLGQLYDDIARNCCTGTSETLLSRETGHRLRRDRLDFSIVLRRENFEALVSKLNRATLFQYDIVTQKDMSKSLTPLQPFARLERRTVKFTAGTTGKQIVGALADLLPEAVRGAMFRVSGFDDDGDRFHVDFDSAPPDEFAKEHVDMLADEVVLKFDDITQSTYVDVMLEVLAENPALLGQEEDE